MYQRLAALLAGEAPRGLLPPAPRGYVALRIRQLAGRVLMDAVCSALLLPVGCSFALVLLFAQPGSILFSSGLPHCQGTVVCTAGEYPRSAQGYINVAERGMQENRRCSKLQ